MNVTRFLKKKGNKKRDGSEEVTQTGPWGEDVTHDLETDKALSHCQEGELVIECLPSSHKTMGSIPCTTKK
jgi:hypothetical protein